MAKDKLLIVEDDLDIIKMLDFYFTTQGYEVLTAMRGDVAVEICRTTLPNLALLDVQLPGLTGFEIGKALHENVRTRHIPIIFLSAFGEKKNRLYGLGEIQAWYYIVKPFDVEEVHTIVKSALDRSREKKLAHPVTNMPTGELINDQYRALLTSNAWALALIHINGFDSFKQVYGQVGSEEVLNFAARLLNEVVNDLGKQDDFIGQMIVNPDFVIISTLEQLQAICAVLCKRFDAEIGLCYNYKDRQNGYITVNDTQGNPQQQPLMSISIGVITNSDGPFYDIRSLSEIAEEVRLRATIEARYRRLRSYIAYGRLTQTMPECVELLQRVVGQPDLSLLTIRIQGATADVRTILEQAVAIPEAQQVVLIGDADLLVVVSTHSVDSMLDHMFDHFDRHPLVQQTQAILLFGLCSNGFGKSIAEIVEAVAVDFVARAESRNITLSSDPAILVLAPGYPTLRRRYEAAQAKLEAYHEELNTYLKIDRLTATVDHDLNGGLAGLKSAIDTSIDQLSPAAPVRVREELHWLQHRLILCTAWQRSIIELGTGKLLQPRLISVSSWLDQHMVLLRDQLADRFEQQLVLDIDVPDALQTVLDAQGLLVACLHVLLAAYSSGAKKLRIAAETDEYTSSFVLVFRDDGDSALRLRSLQSDTAPTDDDVLSWQVWSIASLRRILQAQNIILHLQQIDSILQMTWNVPIQHVMGLNTGLVAAQHRPRPPSSPPPEGQTFSALRRIVFHLEQEVVLLQEQIGTPVVVAGRFNKDIFRRILLPYVQELEQNLLVLDQHAEALTTDAHIDVALARRIQQLSLYCYLLMRNLLLALHGARLPVEAIEVNEQIQQVLELLGDMLTNIGQIRIDFAKDLPRVSLAAVEAKQILMNIIKNAIEAGTSGLSITTSSQRNMIVIQIKDTGIGVTQEDGKQMFDLSFSTKNRRTNFGIGLHIVESVVLRVGGLIRVASATRNAAGKLVFWDSGFEEATIPWDGTGTLIQIELPVTEENRIDAAEITHTGHR